MLLEPGRHHEIALLAVGVAVEREGGGRYPRGACTNQSVGVLPVGGDGSDREARVDQRLQVRAVPGDEDADHAIRPITSSPGAGSATTAHQPIPRLKTRRSSSSATWRASQSNTGGRGQEPQSISACVPSGSDAAQVAEDPAAGDVGECLRAAAQSAGLVEVEPGRGEQVGPVVVLGLEHPPHEREPVRVHAGRREADHGVAGHDVAPVDELVAIDDADAGAGEVELAVAVDPGELRRLAADERDAGRAADLGGSLDELGDLVELDRRRRDVVEQHQRRGAGGQDVVDAVRGEIAAAVGEPSALPREHQLRPDAVGRGGEQAPVVERVEPREGPESGRSGRLDRGAQPRDDAVRDRERDSRLGVALLSRGHRH